MGHYQIHLPKFGRAGGSRTHTGVTPADFKSAASAISPPPHGCAISQTLCQL